MYQWEKQIQQMVDEIDSSIRAHNDDALTLSALSRRLGYSEYHMSRKFREIAGLSLRDYLRRRKLAFALKELRDSERSILAIALDYGFSTHEAFTRAFKSTYGVTPGEYRANPSPVVLRTKLHPVDRYFFGLGEIGMIKSEEGVKVYLDKSLKRFETVFPAAGSSNSAIELTIPELEELSGYTAWVDVAKEVEA